MGAPLARVIERRRYTLDGRARAFSVLLFKVLEYYQRAAPFRGGDVFDSFRA